MVHMSRPRLIFPLIVLTFGLIGLLAACGRGDETVPQFVVDEQVQVTCSDECAAHGQCGALVDDARVVLASEGGPAVTLHDRLFVEETLVTILELSQRELIAARDGAPLLGQATPFPHVFYRVSSESKTAWVSEWCLARP